MAEWEPRMEPYARGYVTRARPLWGTGVVPALTGATSTASPYCAVLRGAPWTGSGLFPGELGPKAHERSTSFSLCTSANCCVLGPP